MKKNLLVSITILLNTLLYSQNPLIGTWVGKYSMAYNDDDKFEHLPLPFVLSFTNDTMEIQYYDEIYTSEEVEKLPYKLNKNIIEFYEGDDTYQILMIGVSKDTLAIYGEDFEDGLLVFSKANTDSKTLDLNLNLNNRSFVLRNSDNKALDTFDFFIGNAFLQYNSPEKWTIDNYQVLKFGANQYLDLRNDKYSFLKIISIEKNKIELLNELNGIESLNLTELIRPKKNMLTKTKWSYINPEKPCKKITVGFNDSLINVTAEKEDASKQYTDNISHFYCSYNERFILTLPENYKNLNPENGIILAGSFNFYQCKQISKDQLNLYNHSRGMTYNPFICGREFEIRLVKAK